MSEEPIAGEGPEGIPAPSVRSAGLVAVLRLLRPRQWTKNLLVFAALVFARRLLDPVSFAKALAAFASFCLFASATYALNDVLDAERDRAHPRKRLRPVASGALSPGAALAIATACAAAAVLIALQVNSSFLAAGLIYLGLTWFYSTVGKNVPILDILLIASGFVIRAVAGALAIEVPSSSWFLACTLFAAVFLALCKRKAELDTLAGGAERHRPVLVAYTPALLQTLIAATMAAVLLSYALYVFDVRERAGAELHPIELTLPCVVYGLFRYALLVETRGLGGSPEEVLLSDRGIQVAALAFVLIAVFAVYGR